MIEKLQLGQLVEGILPGSAPAVTQLSLAEKRKNGGDGKVAAPKRADKDHGLYRNVLLFGKNRELALYRAEVLNYSGFSVLIPRNRQEAIDAIRHGDFDAAILSYTLSADTVEELAELVRQHCPNCPLITISQERTADRRIGPDAIVLAEDGPPALVETLRRVLGKRAQ